MEVKVGKFSFTIPVADEGPQHPEAGVKKEKTFEYPQCTTEQEAQDIITSKKWSVLGMVNEVLKNNARSSAYQAAMLPYKPSEVPPAEIQERMVRDYIRLGVAEDVARKQVAALLAASSGQ